jgi:signal transduction histidine kinase
MWRSGASPLRIVVDLAVAFAAVGVSFAVWEANPANRIGPLLVAGKIWYLCSAVRYISSPIWISFGWVAQLAASAVFAHLVLAYPSGRLRGRLDTGFVVAAYAYGFAYPLAELMVAPARELFGKCLTGPCPVTPPYLTSDPALFMRMQAAGDVVSGVLVLGFLLLVIRRLVSATPWRRRHFMPIAVIAVLAAADFVADTFLPPGTGGHWNVVNLVDNGVELAIAFTFFGSLYASRLERAQVADVLGRLADAPPAALQALLSRLLHDPALRLGLWDADRGEYRGPDGGPDVVRPGPGQASTAIDGADEPLGVLVHDPAILDDPQLMASVLSSVRLALENEQLHARLRARLAEIQASRARLVQAEDRARRLVERDLHDGAQQRLLSIGLALQLARREVADGSTAAELLEESEHELAQAIEELRDLAHGIHPTVLSELGLEAAVSALARRLAIPVDIGAMPAGRLPHDAETTAYFVICEALQNTVKHARARRAKVDVQLSGTLVVIEVRDDGMGGADLSCGSGLAGLRDRVEAVGGLLTVESPSGHGTTVRAELRCG